MAKTSGARGLHLYAGLTAGATFVDTRAYAKAVAQMLNREQPDEVTDRIGHAERAGRVLIDWRQNERARSQVAPYSLRATPWPLVSTPVTWDEVEACATGDAQLWFTPAQVLDRVAARGDLFAAALSRSARIP